jgi:hypothetical protein
MRSTVSVYYTKPLLWDLYFLWNELSCHTQTMCYSRVTFSHGSRCWFGSVTYPYVNRSLATRTKCEFSRWLRLPVPYFILPIHEFLHCCGGILYIETFERDDVLLNIMVTWVFYDSLIFVCVHHLYGVFLWNYDLITLVGGLLLYWRLTRLYLTTCHKSYWVRRDVQRRQRLHFVYNNISRSGETLHKNLCLLRSHKKTKMSRSIHWI